MLQVFLAGMSHRVRAVDEFFWERSCNCIALKARYLSQEDAEKDSECMQTRGFEQAEQFSQNKLQLHLHAMSGLE